MKDEYREALENIVRDQKRWMITEMMVDCQIGKDEATALVDEFLSEVSPPQDKELSPEDTAIATCEACGKHIQEGEPYLWGPETSLCSDWAPTYQALLDDPEGFVTADGDPLTPEQCRAWYDKHIAAGGKATDSMGKVERPSSTPAPEHQAGMAERYPGGVSGTVAWLREQAHIAFQKKDDAQANHLMFSADALEYYFEIAPRPEHTAPIEHRNNEAGFVEFINEDRPYIVRDLPAPCAILTDMETRRVIGYRVYDPDGPAPSSHLSGWQPMSSAPRDGTHILAVLYRSASDDIEGRRWPAFSEMREIWFKPYRQIGMDLPWHAGDPFEEPSELGSEHMGDGVPIAWQPLPALDVRALATAAEGLDNG